MHTTYGIISARRGYGTGRGGRHIFVRVRMFFLTQGFSLLRNFAIFNKSSDCFFEPRYLSRARKRKAYRLISRRGSHGCAPCDAETGWRVNKTKPFLSAKKAFRSVEGGVIAARQNKTKQNKYT